MARSFEVQVLHLNLAITAYLLSLAVFLPASAWMASRFGQRRVFCAAVFLFALGSALCAAAPNVPVLVLSRMVQGIGGAMMLPVGRTILLRSVAPDQMVKAMVWFTVPGVLGRLSGPLLGGVIVTWTSWHWMFLFNIPFATAGIFLALRLIEPDPDPPAHPAERFDILGFGLLALGLAAILGSLESAGHALLNGPANAALFLTGGAMLWFYARRSRALPHPVLDFSTLRNSAFRLVTLGGWPLWLAIGAAPFLIPLLLQVGFSIAPLNAGLLATGTAVGALATRVVMTRAINAFGFRTVLITASVLAACFYRVYGLFSATTPHGLMFALFVMGGLCASMVMVSMNTLGFATMPRSLMGHASTISTMSQQVSMAAGVVSAGWILGAASHFHGRTPAQLEAQDFVPAFSSIALLALTSAWAFTRLDAREGDTMRVRSKDLPGHRVDGSARAFLGAGLLRPHVGALHHVGDGAIDPGDAAVGHRPVLGRVPRARRGRHRLRGGWLGAQRRGSARVAGTQLAISGACCLAAPLLLGAPDAAFYAWLVLWGITVSGDSPQFSTLTARNAPPQAVGSVLTLTNSIGFGISIASILLFVWLAESVSLGALLPWLAVGPALGLWALRPLLAEESAAR